MDKPTIEEMDRLLDKLFRAATLGQNAARLSDEAALIHAIRAILSDYPKLQAELARVKEERDYYRIEAGHLLERAKFFEARLALAEPLLKAAREWDGRIVGESHMRLILALDAYRKAAEGAKEKEDGK